MYYVVFFVHLVIAALLMVVVLLQRSKGNGLAGAFGGMGAGEAMFGAQGVTTFLHKATIYLAAAFMLTSLTLAYLTAAKDHGSGSSVVRRAAQQVPVSPTASPLDATPVVPTTGGAESVEGEPGAAAGQEASDDIVPPAPDAGSGQTEESGTTGGGGGGNEAGGR